MDWAKVYGAQDDSLEGMLARGQVNNSAMMQVARELEQRKQADRSFGLQEENARENRELRVSQQKSLDDDRKERAVDRDENRKVAKTGRFLATLPLRKKGDLVTPEERVTFAQEGLNGSAVAAGADAHGEGPHFHFAGTAAQDDSDARQAHADKQGDEAVRHNQAMESAAQRNAAAAEARAASAGGRGQMSGYQLSTLTRNLRGEYNKLTAPSREMTRQLAMMDTGLAEAKKGNMNAGTQAVIATFNKILDPTSVVRESEYARSPEGMALMQRMQGFIPKLTQGGIGMTPETLAQFGDLARTFTANAHATSQKLVTPLLMQASDAGIDPTRITTDEREPAAPAGAAPVVPATSVAPAAAPAAPTDSAARAAALLKKYGGG